MGTGLPDSWLDLPAIQRDVLIVLDTEGPKTGNQIFQAVGNREGRQYRNIIYGHLSSLEDEGYVEATEKDDRSHEYSITSPGRSLVHKVGEVLVG